MGVERTKKTAAAVMTPISANYQTIDLAETGALPVASQYLSSSDVRTTAKAQHALDIKMNELVPLLAGWHEEERPTTRLSVGVVPLHLTVEAAEDNDGGASSFCPVNRCLGRQAYIKAK